MTAVRDAAASPAGGAPVDALVLHAEDNVATALRPLAAGALVRAQGAGRDHVIALGEPIPLCHKFALVDVPAGAVVRKYGEAIGTTREAIPAGAHVHVHNLVSQRARQGR